MKVFRTRKYNYDQIVDALTCPVNRHMTRIEHSCNDQDLYEHPEWLVNHYVKHGGREAFALRREEYVREILTEEETIEYYI